MSWSWFHFREEGIGCCLRVGGQINKGQLINTKSVSKLYVLY